MGFKDKIFINNNPPELEDDDLNGYSTELDNTYLTSGQTPNNGDLSQTSKAMAIYTAGSDFYLETGVADAYVLSPSGTFVAPIVYFVGMRIRFIPSNTNTGASTVNVATLGVQSIKAPDGFDPSGGSIVAGKMIEAIFDGADFIAVSGIFGITQTDFLPSNTTAGGTLTLPTVIGRKYRVSSAYVMFAGDATTRIGLASMSDTAFKIGAEDVSFTAGSTNYFTGEFTFTPVTNLELDYTITVITNGTEIIGTNAPDGTWFQSTEILY